MKIPLSTRLLACCNYVNQGDRVADVGCDHGYLGIHLLTQGIASSVTALPCHLPQRGRLKNATPAGTGMA